MLQNVDIADAMDRLTLPWLAGFFDGEGSVYAGLSNGAYNVRISITQKDPTILALIGLKYKANCISKKMGSGGKISCQVRLGGRSALPFLYDIKDLVIVKRRQVELAIKLISLVDNTGESYEERRMLAIQISQLNRQGNESGIPIQ